MIVSLRETRVEKRLRLGVEKFHGKALKLFFYDGIPDRLIILPGGRTYFVETKAPGKKLEPLQIIWREMLTKMGFDIRVIDTLEKVEAFLNEIRT